MTLPSIIKLNHSFYATQAQLLASTYKNYTGKPLLEHSPHPTIEELFAAPLIILSHGAEEDPLFNFSSQQGLDLFGYSFEEFIHLPSRKSAEMVEREERAKLLAQVTAHGFVADYRGVRIAANGKRFYIENAVVWNLVGDQGLYHGQAAAFSNYSPL